MPATPRGARACALALAGLGLAALGTPVLAVTAQPALASTSDSAGDRAGATLTASAKKPSAKQKVDHRVLGALGTAMRQRGDWYSYGASGPDRFDCSGLVYYSYRRAGFPVPRTSGAQSGYARHVAKKDLRAGDLMFFYGSGGVYHAAIFLRWTHGHALMLHAPGYGQRVQVAVPWTSQWFGGTLRRR